jgi:hypothetical protein
MAGALLVALPLALWYRRRQIPGRTSTEAP